MSEDATPGRIHTAALVVAAGSGRRLGSEIPKQYLDLAGETPLRRSLSTFCGHPGIDAVMAVITPSHWSLYEKSASGLPKLLPPAEGGETRQASVRGGLEAVAAYSPEVVLIHDAARPFVSQELVSKVISAVDQTHGAMPGLPLTDTVKRIRLEQAAIQEAVETIDRESLVSVQTPQGFPFRPLLAAHRSAVAAGQTNLTDDAAVAALAGLAVRVVDGDRRNTKLTTASDFAAAEEVLATGMETHTAQGFDVHAFRPGEAVRLCGVDIPHTHSLVGHSDADVGLHALTDALLGTIGDGDIGVHFPPSDPKWRGASSDRFLHDAVRRVRERGGRIVHLDVTLVCEAPRISDHRQAMREAIERIAEVPVACVSIKATTNEGLGFIGRGEGIAAMAIATVMLPKGR